MRVYEKITKSQQWGHYEAWKSIPLTQKSTPMNWKPTPIQRDRILKVHKNSCLLFELCKSWSRLICTKKKKNQLINKNEKKKYCNNEVTLFYPKWWNHVHKYIFVIIYLLFKIWLVIFYDKRVKFFFFSSFIVSKFWNENYEILRQRTKN